MEIDEIAAGLLELDFVCSYHEPCSIYGVSPLTWL